jgi:superfamily II DNA or RNA helicase
LTSLRSWQVRALERMATWHDGAFLLNAAPGAGKTRPSIELAKQALKAGVVQRVAIVCPTSPLTRQWAQAAGRLGLHLAPDAPDLRPPRDFHGVAVTYARVASSAAAFARTCTPGTLVVADEVHHLGDDLAWGTAFEAAFATAGRRLLLSGTPFRSDATAIPGVAYGGDGVARPDFTYGYDDAVRDGICRPVTFIPFDGTLQWRSGDDVVEAGFNDVLSGRESSRRYRTAISTELENGLPRILREAHERLERLRRPGGGHRDAGGLVIAADSEHAARVAKVLREITGEAPTVVVHTDARAHAKLEAFRKGTQRWIVAVNMVSEGVDIPRLRVGVYATAAKTALIFRQIVGRFVRVIPGRAVEPSWLYIPGDPVLQSHAADVERELLHVLAPVGIGEDLLDEPPDRTETEPSETPDFVPLAADVAPQMALFGGGPPAPVVAPGAPAPIDAEPEPSVSAFERRKRLREDRRRLVTDLARKQRRTPAEINAWINAEVGVPRVQDATIDQLEKSIDLLFDSLRAAPVRRRAASR